MTELDIETFQRLVYRKLDEIEGREIVLKDPTTESVFPCTVLRTPLESMPLRPHTENCIPVRKLFQITIEEWCDKQYDCMARAQETTIKLREYNIIKTSNDISVYDDITKKYRLINNYEVYYNGLTNSFERIK